MGNQLSSDTWLKVSDEVIKELPGVFKLVDDPKKVDAVTKFPMPMTQKELWGWMGL